MAQTTNSPLKEISPGIFQLGLVQLDKEQKTIQFPASVNMTNGLIEYFVVTGTGKLHESILKTEIEPSQIHLAMLLIGAEGTPTNSSSTNISGDKLTIDVSWKDGGIAKRFPAEDFILHNKGKSPMAKEGWIYNGSKIMDGTFIAQRDGSIVSIITDQLALANCLHPEHDNDEIWFVNTNVVPALNTKVEVTLKLKSQQKNTKEPR